MEIEEVCVENQSLPFEDYIECRRFALTVTLFYCDKVMFELTQFIKHMGFKVSQWLHRVHECHPEFPDKLSGIYDQFTKETREELAESREEFERWLKYEPGVMEDYINGERGNNILFNTQARVHLEAMKELHEVAFRCAAEFTEVSQHKDSEHLVKYLKELERYALLKRQNFTDVNSSYAEEFNFDFVTLESEHFKSLPAEERPTKVRFYYQQWQKDYFEDTIQRHGESIQAMGKIFSRIRIKSLQRVVARESQWDDVKWINKAVK